MPTTLRQRLRIVTSRDMLYWKSRVILARLRLAWLDLRTPIVARTLRLAVRLNLPVPDAAFRFGMRLCGLRWPDNAEQVAVRVIYYGEPLP